MLRYYHKLLLVDCLQLFNSCLVGFDLVAIIYFMILWLNLAISFLFHYNIVANFVKKFKKLFWYFPVLVQFPKLLEVMRQWIFACLSKYVFSLILILNILLGGYQIFAFWFFSPIYFNASHVFGVCRHDVAYLNKGAAYYLAVYAILYDKILISNVLKNDLLATQEIEYFFNAKFLFHRYYYALSFYFNFEFNLRLHLAYDFVNTY